MSKDTLVAGHLTEKNGLYYIILNLKDEKGKRKPKWIPTGLKIKGNKKRAESLLMDARKEYTEFLALNPQLSPIGIKLSQSDTILFSDYMSKWLEIAKSTVEITTYASYAASVKQTIVPYFKTEGITLQQLQPRHIQDFYLAQLEKVSPNTVIKYHANIHRALKYAVRTGLIPGNPSDLIDRPKKNPFTASFYSKEEMATLLEAVKGHKLELGVLLAAFYGLRRSEVIGLKYDAIDFEANTITIQHVVTRVTLDGKAVIVAKNRTKSKSSNRSLPLVPQFRERLLEMKEQRDRNMEMCGKSYCMDYLDYIYVDQMGWRMLPDYLSRQFPLFLERNNLRRIRYHDLRHSCASLLLASGIPLKAIQEWLGHSDFSTTANIYAHLDADSKQSSAKAMLAAMNFSSDVQEDKKETANQGELVDS